MDIVIISQYLRDITDFENNNSRFVYLAGMLSENNSIEIITSDFNHGTKKHFQSIGSLQKIKITALHEKGYPKNVCLRRFLSHKELSINLKKYLSNRIKPDIIYCAVPSLDVAYEAAKYCEKNNVKFIVDIQDLWPEAFKLVFNVPVVSDIIFAPMAKKANYIYAAADEIIAVSETYADRGVSVNKKCGKGHVVFLGTDLNTFDNNSRTQCELQKPSDKLWLAYCGTLGSSYDLTCVLDALKIIKDKGVTPPEFIVMGDGPKREQFEAYAKESDVNVHFTGRLSYDKMCSLLVKCDIVVNPIMHGAAQSIINKHSDYAASGLPVLSTQENEEYRKLVEHYNMGINCSNNNPDELAENIILLCSNNDLRQEMGKNARKCAEEKFDRRNSYNEIVQLIF